MIYVSIDVGIVNLAVVKAEVHDFQITKILASHVINLNNLLHQRVSRKDCLLHHSNDVFDKIEHLLQEHGHLFADVDHLLIERQPITGLVHVEQILFGKFRSIARLISPNAMHKWLCINHLDYDQRKIETTRVARPYLHMFPSWVETERVHDMADSLCILLYTLHVDKQQSQTPSTRELEWNGPLQTFFDQFRYAPSPPMISSSEWLARV